MLDPTLTAIVDSEFVPIEELSLRIPQAARGGATLLQTRVKRLATAEWLRYVREAERAARGAGVPLIVNDRADLAIVAGAAGVHLGEQDLPVRDARKLLGPGAIIGATARDAGAAAAAEAAGADYLGVGPLFATSTKPDLPVLERGRIGEIRSATNLPLVGIGGIDPEGAAEAARLGLDGIAVISALWKGGDPERAAREFITRFREGKR